MNMLNPNMSVSTNHVKPEAPSARSISLVSSSCFFRSIFDWNTRRSLLTISSSWSLPYSSGCADHKRASLLEGRGFKKSPKVEILENNRKDFRGILVLTTFSISIHGKFDRTWRRNCSQPGHQRNRKKTWSFTGEHHISHNSRWVLLGTKQCSNQALLVKSGSRIAQVCCCDTSRGVEYRLIYQTLPCTL